MRILVTGTSSGIGKAIANTWDESYHYLSPSGKVAEFY